MPMAALRRELLDVATLASSLAAQRAHWAAAELPQVVARPGSEQPA